MERKVSTAGTADRVRASTARPVNRRLDRRTMADIRKVADAGPRAITTRLAQLDEEWDVERALQVNAAVAVMAGLYLGLKVSRRWLALPAIVAGFLVEHAVQGWCPPVSILRRIGLRTQQEINEEKMALRVLRGDFTPTPDPELALAQVRRKPVAPPERGRSRNGVEPVAESGAAAVGYGYEAEQMAPPGHVVVSPVDRPAVGEWAARDWEGDADAAETDGGFERTARLRAPGRNLRGVLAPFYLQKH